MMPHATPLSHLDKNITGLTAATDSGIWITHHTAGDAQSNGFTLSQNMNHKLENGQTLDATETYVAQRLDAAMHLSLIHIYILWEHSRIGKN